MSRTKRPLHASLIICKDCNARLGTRSLEGRIELTSTSRDPEWCIHPKDPAGAAIQCPRVKAAIARHQLS